ncbi:short chain dehydrogenase [Arachidicoccus terrestris]|uniref:short chain dehydrogenase n=1 Tax=Arachidicoccus terrestris TaxID=2875539 RepID=UPI001CC7FA41|nr:short chain dehydrogenase [Arachidicoccus terrestris]UAY54429.1 short chain dehydrogenase [Arachidicoccus terrestris]
MKILLIGATGAIGRLIQPALQIDHDVISVGRSNGDILADISAITDIRHLFKRSGKVDAIICVAGSSVTGELDAMDITGYEAGIQQKLLSQINLVLIGLNYVNDNGSITLISGKIGESPVKGSSGKAVPNGAVNSFVKAAALEMPRGIRLNAISPAKISDIPANDLVLAYIKSIESKLNGAIIRIGYK